MNIWQVIGVFVGIPAGIIAFLALCVYGRVIFQQPNRYRPGKAWDFPPSWYVPHPDAVVPREHGTATTAVGGASGEW